MRFCGIDPGLQITGYGVIETRLPATVVVEAGVLRPGGDSELAPRLAKLAADIDEVLGEHEPDVMAVEALYSHYRHPRTAIMMGHARGVILAAAAARGIEVVNVSATAVKKSLTGNGRASKAQMQRAIMASLGLSRPPDPPDVADALAVALCAARKAGKKVAR
jgi:crossover junction endodeoxyribonuclease RuvC